MPHQQHIELDRLEMAELAHLMTIAEVPFAYDPSNLYLIISDTADEADRHRFTRVAELRNLKVTTTENNFIFIESGRK
jgi:hypothetical protein